MTLYFLYENANVPVESIEGALRQALDDKDSSVVFSALSVWKLILVVRKNLKQKKEISIVTKNICLCTTQ